MTDRYYREGETVYALQHKDGTTCRGAHCAFGNHGANVKKVPEGMTVRSGKVVRE